MLAQRRDHDGRRGLCSEDVPVPGVCNVAFRRLVFYGKHGVRVVLDRENVGIESVLRDPSVK